MSTDPDWWRGQPPPDHVPEEWGWVPGRWISGQKIGALDRLGRVDSGLQDVLFFRADVRDVELWLNDVHLGVAWSEFKHCHFRQRVRPVLNRHGIAAQGSLGIRPSIYRNCRFERVRFKTLGGFSTSQARFVRCTFINCRWEGHFAEETDVIDSSFVGRMNGCVWFGHSTVPDGTRRRNIIRGNDFTQTHITGNVAWRDDFPVSDQAWPVGYHPLIDDN